jgi:hypothetical protein
VALVYGLTLIGLLFTSVPIPRLAAQSGSFNPPPCDFNDAFYTANGISLQQLDTAAAGRFGIFRQTGPPATGSQLNWVNDTSCSGKDPDRTNVRILATTAAYKDDDGAPTEFFSIIAFVLNQNFFTGVANARSIQMVDIVSNFEAYVGTTQRVNGQLAPEPCGTMGDGQQPCFPVTSVATPQLRQDWRVASNRNAIDGSDNNDPLGRITGTVHNSPFGYFCDDLLGMWIVTYFWYTEFAVGGRPGITPTANCQRVLAAASAQNGTTLDGTPIIRTGDELHFIEGVPGTSSQFGLSTRDLPPLSAPCGKEGNLDAGGADGGAVWLICPVIQDPRNGAIATDAFLDSVKRNGVPLDNRFNRNFNCLQTVGDFPNPQNGC